MVRALVRLMLSMQESANRKPFENMNSVILNTIGSLLNKVSYVLQHDRPMYEMLNMLLSI